jgi:hypothetical protein
MPRGKRAEIGDRTVNKNGYEFVRTEEGWKGAHIIVMEQHLGRPLEPNEYVAFKNGHTPPITLDMIELRKRGDRKSRASRIAEIEARIEELQGELEHLKREEESVNAH